MKKLIQYFFILFCTSSLAQQIVRSTIGSIGSSISNGNIIIQQTAGQPSAISFTKNEDGSSIRQGFHQPFYFSVERNELNVKVFPNPNNGQFSFQADLLDDSNYDYLISDPQGKVILKNNASGNKIVDIKLDQPANGLYHLQIIKADKSSSFKIIITN